MALPMVRHSERVDFKRCHKKWFWNWRMGLVPRQHTYGALDLGTWMHAALEHRYTNKRRMALRHWFNAVAGEALRSARVAEVPLPQYEKAQELAQLGLAMAGAYDKKYGADRDIVPIGAEIPLEFTFSDEDDKPLGIHKLKPDLLFHKPHDPDALWLLENKTAKQIRLEHLAIDDQARGYAAMAEAALVRKGMLKRGQYVKGVLYNFLRKALPDEREQNAQGQYLNQNGSVSKRQPTPVFIRHPIELSPASKRITLERIRGEVSTIVKLNESLRRKEKDPKYLQKTPHSSCPKLCPFFSMCVAEEQGTDVREMQQRMYTRQDPYAYEDETTDIPTSFELG